MEYKITIISCLEIVAVNICWYIIVSEDITALPQLPDIISSHLYAFHENPTQPVSSISDRD